MQPAEVSGGIASGNVVLVTGSARGIGAAIARWLATEGAVVELLDVLDEAGEAAAADIRESGGRARYRSLDVTDEQSWERVVAGTIDTYGGVNALVNNAGINSRAGLMSVTTAEWDDVMRVNLVGPMLGMRAVVPAMRAAGKGSIVNIASQAAFIAFPSAAYSASKWGLRGLSKSAALELGSDNIRVNCVHPGGVVSDMSSSTSSAVFDAFIAATPLRRLGQPQDVAAMAGLLCTDATAFVTGNDFLVDGGFVSGSGLASVAAATSGGWNSAGK